MAKVIVRAPFAYDSDSISENTGLFCDDPSLTVQDQAEEADINTLVKRFGLTGEIPILERVPINADFVGLTDFKSAMDSIREAELAFGSLPADIRKKFNHDPGEFVAFCSDEKNRDEMVKMGFVEKPVDPAAPVLVQVVPEAKSPA